MRCRCTALPTDFETTRPIRGPSSKVPSEDRNACTTRSGCTARTPWLIVAPPSMASSGTARKHRARSRVDHAVSLRRPLPRRLLWHSAARKSMHPRPTAVIGLKGPFAAGRIYIPLRDTATHHETILMPVGTRLPFVSFRPSRLTGAVSRDSWSQPYRHVRATVPMTRIRARVKPRPDPPRRGRTVLRPATARHAFSDTVKEAAEQCCRTVGTRAENC